MSRKQNLGEQILKPIFEACGEIPKQPKPMKNDKTKQRKHKQKHKNKKKQGPLKTMKPF